MDFDYNDSIECCMCCTVQYCTRTLCSFLVQYILYIQYSNCYYCTTVLLYLYCCTLTLHAVVGLASLGFASLGLAWPGPPWLVTVALFAANTAKNSLQPDVPQLHCNHVC